MNKNSVVIGHLKLQFIGNDNKRYVIARSVQAKQGPKTVAIKTLDSTMRLVKIYSYNLHKYVDEVVQF